LRAQVKELGGSCLCLTPRHPIFSSNGPPFYTAFLPPRHSPQWGEAVEWVLEERPGVIEDRDWRWENVMKAGQMTESQYDELKQLLISEYVPRTIGPSEFLIRRDGEAIKK
jgi:hypothetical protein